MATIALEEADLHTGLMEPDGLYEVVDGRIVEKPMGAYEVWWAGVIATVLGPFVKSSRLGRVVQEMMFDLRPRFDRERRPDVAFVSYERWPRSRRVTPTRSWAVIPDLAVEVVSPTNTAVDVADKLEEYFEVGVRQVWVVYPVQMKVYVYASTTSVKILTPADEIDGGEILPGFRLPLSDLFNEADPPA